jgi:hypothetical protein
VLFSAEFLRVWRLGTLPLTRGDELLARRSPRAVARILREGYRVSTVRDNTIFSMVATFVWTFGWARAITYAIRVRGGLGPIKDLKTASGRHIHHFLPGMILALLAGGWSIASHNQELDRWLAFPFGLGTALVVDEAERVRELATEFLRGVVRGPRVVAAAARARPGARSLVVRVRAEGARRLHGVRIRLLRGRRLAPRRRVLRVR